MKKSTTYASVYSIIIAFVVFAFSGINASCTDNNATKVVPMNYFGGEFVYFADAARIYDCATGKDYPVGYKGEYLNAERGYLSLNLIPGEKIYIEFKGSISQEPAMEGDGTIETITIDTLIKFDGTVVCNPSFILAGVYANTEPEKLNISIQLKPDYTYKQIVFGKDGSERIITGKWGKVSDLEVGFIAEADTMSIGGVKSANSIKNPQQTLLQMYPSDTSLGGRWDGKSVIFKKVDL